MRYLNLPEVLWLHRQVLERSGGASGIRDVHALESALAQPRATFDSEELYPALLDKVAAVGFSLVLNHPFMDGNKRVGHAAMAIMLSLNGYEFVASADEQEDLMLGLAAGTVTRQELHDFIATRSAPRTGHDAS